jgi:LysM repeat protein
MAAVQQPVVPIVYEYPLPESLSLCDEPIPLEDRYVREMLDREFTVAVWDRAQVFMWLKRAGRYFPYIEGALAEAGLPGDLKYLAVAESALLPQISSGKGAVGVWQFMSTTGDGNGLRQDYTTDERRNFEKSTDAAIKYLKMLKEKFGNWSLALAAYNMGESALNKEMEEQKADNYYKLNLPPETERFVFRIAAIKVIMEDPEKYGYNLPDDRVYTPVETDEVQVDVVTSLHIADIAESIGTEFKTIKELNPQIIGYYLPIGSYNIKVPSGLGAKTAAALKKIESSYAGNTGGGSGNVYTVRPGDTLINISKKTGISVSVLKRMNGLNSALIKVGQKLRIAP